MFDLTGQSALVTGGTRGIGKACAHALHAAGARVALCGRNEDSARAVAAEIGEGALGFGCDIGDSAAVDQLLKSVTEAFGGLDILVNNAGITRDGLLMRMKNEHWDDVLRTNLNSAFYTCRAAAKAMLKNRYGRIINMSSVVGIHGQGGQANYAAAKAGLIGFSKAYAQEVASRNITVNVIAPGYIATDMTADLGEAATSAVLERVPLKRVGTPEDIASAVVFLASKESAYITGAVLSVDGGLGM
ncbi:MAG: 3-oxoacyl-[acyl-carrier-protein] reductase [Candidatus Hydrogenedentes bacterium]|nr:3-oxoacyl-[acyl-carrier-protein] reductase [Candidatus Hydrogenedentota bacterium]